MNILMGFVAGGKVVYESDQVFSLEEAKCCLACSEVGIFQVKKEEETFYFSLDGRILCCELRSNGEHIENTEGERAEIILDSLLKKEKEKIEC